MPCRAFAILALLALVLPLGLAPAAGLPAASFAAPSAAPSIVSPAAPPAAEPVTSALVGIDGPSVYRKLAMVAARESAAAMDATVVDPSAGPVVGDAAINAAWIAARGIDVRAIEAAVRRQQAPVVLSAERLGITVISRYTTSANGLLVHATASQLAALRQVRGVAYVEPAPIVRPMLALSVPHIGATRLAKDLGYDGKGSIVAIIDTGVDYTHGHLGGPGTVEAYEAATRPGMTEVITDTWEGKLLFPTEKFVGGYDFVGPRYNPPHIPCTPQRLATIGCSDVPEPDSDPLDGGGHGTHVSGISAGHGVDAIGDGVAPGAQLVGLKLYGTGGADEAADVLVDSIEWCAGVNLGTETRGVIPPRVDAINISLGEDFAQGSRMFDEAVEAAVGSGIVIAASAGNSGNRPFVLGVPSASPKVLSVANSLPPSLVLDIEARWEDQKASYPAIESAIGVPLAQAGKIEGELALYGLACNDQGVPVPPVQEVREKVALVARGDCVFAEKMLNAQAAGAIAVLMFTNTSPKNAMGGDDTGIAIPAVMIDQQPGLDLQAKLEAGTRVDVTIDDSNRRLDYSSADAIAGSSSRGPSKNGALKPDITGPGTGINSAALGSGRGGVSFSGTSMSSPHLAGAAALVHHRNRAESLGLGAADLAALLMNYSRPVIFTPGTDKVAVPVVRQGAGLVDLWRSGTAKLVVRAGDIASINLGPLALTRAARIERTLHVRNLGAEPITFRVDASIQAADDQGKGVTIETPSEPVTLAGKAETTVTVVFNIDPNALREWTLRPAANAAAGPVDVLEIGGYVTVTPVDTAGSPIPDAPIASLPFYTLPRQASDIRNPGLPAALRDSRNTLTFNNASPYAGDVDLFMLPTVTGDGLTVPAPEDPDEPEVLHELDLRRVGVRIEPGAGAEDTPMLSFGIARHAIAAIPQNTRTEIYLDTDRDGAIDRRVRSGTAPNSDAMRTWFARWDPVAGAIVAGTEAFTGTLHATDLHTHLSMMSVPITALGMSVPAPFDFYVVHRGLNEDWLFQTTIDVAPDGAEGPLGPRYQFDPGALARVPESWSLPVPGSGAANIGLVKGPGEVDPVWLAFYPDNSFDNAGGQMQVIVPGEGGGPATLYLPRLLRGD
jgi:minor extracellular serine protease Vpr